MPADSALHLRSSAPDALCSIPSGFPSAMIGAIMGERRGRSRTCCCMTSRWRCGISAPPVTLTSLRIALIRAVTTMRRSTSHLSDETTYNDLMQRMVASLNKCG